VAISHTVDDQGIAEVVMDHPPVNALPVSAWFELGEVVRSVGADPATRVVVLRAEGRGFNAGVTSRRCRPAKVSTPSSAPTAGALPPSPPSMSAPSP